MKTRQNELQTVLVLSQEFETISEEFVTWLAAIEEEQAKEKTVSAVYETAKKQQQDLKVHKETFPVVNFRTTLSHVRINFSSSTVASA
jgi:hypothetical protein